MPTKTAIARRFHALISANVDAFYADAISYEAFGIVQRDLWDRIALWGVDDAVRALIRDDEIA